jgi:hypothetical protein
VPDRVAPGTLRISVGRDGGSLTTRVQAAGGQPAGNGWVMLLPASARTEAELAASMVVGLTGEDGVHVAQGLRPGLYHVLATSVAPPAMIPVPSHVPRLEKSPETMQLLLRARSSAPQVSVPPGMTVETTVGPRVLR